MGVSKKIVLLGHFGVGKSSLLRRFVEDTFSDDYKVTIGVHIMKKEVIVDNGSICLLYTSPSPRDQRGSRMPSSA